MNNTFSENGNAVKPGPVVRRICLFASGSGSNAEKIIDYFRDSSEVEIAGIFTNNKNSPLLSIATENAVPVFCFSREELYEKAAVEEMLSHLKPDLIVLAGFLWLMPPVLVKRYGGRILNIHPALLPKFGGKGMYGMKVHEAVIAAGEKESGMTVHVIDEEYDKGEIIFQQSVAVPGSEPSALQAAVLDLEHRHYAGVIHDFLKTL
jgi:phosphoribosylglycinamide formyltransferase-1